MRRLPIAFVAFSLLGCADNTGLVGPDGGGESESEGENPCDRDGDGHLAESCGGDDCDDTRATVAPGLSEEILDPDGQLICDGLDNDCNGLTDDIDVCTPPPPPPTCTGDNLLADERLLSSPTFYEQLFPRVEWNEGADAYVVSWGIAKNSAYYYNAHYLLLDACGTVVHPQSSVFDSALGEDAQTWAAWHTSIAPDPTTGSFWIAYHSWCSGAPYCDNSETFLKPFDALGDYAGARIHVNEVTAGVQGLSAVAANATGEVAIAYMSGSGLDYDLMIKSWDDSGGIALAETVAGAVGAGTTSGPSVVIAADSTFVVVWLDSSSNNTVKARLQRFALEGTPLGAPYQFEPSGEDADLAMSAAGDFVVCWSWFNNFVRFQRFDASAAPVGEPVVVDADVDHAIPRGRVAMRPNGDLVIVWSETDGSGTGVWAQTYQADGTLHTSQFLVNTSVTGDQQLADVAFSPSGQMLFVWADYGAVVNGSGFGAPSDIIARAIQF